MCYDLKCSLTQRIFGIEHGLSSHIVLVRDELAEVELIFERGGLDCPDERFHQVDAVRPEVKLEQLIYQRQHSPSLGVIFGGSAEKIMLHYFRVENKLETKTVSCMTR